MLATAAATPEVDGVSDPPASDDEAPLLVAELAARGVTAEIRPWTAPDGWAAADLVVVRSTWDYFERLGEFIEWAEHVAAVTRLTNPLEVLRWNAHKSYLIDLAERGVPTVPTTLVRRGASGAEIQVPVGSEGVVKPAVTDVAIGAVRSEASDPGLLGRLEQLAASVDVLVQPFLRSVIDRC